MPRFLLPQIEEMISTKAPDNYVFTRPNGELLRLTWFRRAVFIPAVEQAGFHGLAPHGLRHTAASLAIASGADVKVVQAMPGHASATMTLDLYGHLYADRLDEVADRMDAARSASRDAVTVACADLVRTSEVEPRGIEL